MQLPMGTLSRRLGRDWFSWDCFHSRALSIIHFFDLREVCLKSNGPSKDMLQLDCSLYKRVNHRLRTETPSTRFIYAWYRSKRSTGAAPDWSNVLATFIVNSALIRATLSFNVRIALLAKKFVWLVVSKSGAIENFQS